MGCATPKAGSAYFPDIYTGKGLGRLRLSRSINSMAMSSLLIRIPRSVLKSPTGFRSKAVQGIPPAMASRFMGTKSQVRPTSSRFWTSHKFSALNSLAYRTENSSLVLKFFPLAIWRLNPIVDLNSDNDYPCSCRFLLLRLLGVHLRDTVVSTVGSRSGNDNGCTEQDLVFSFGFCRWVWIERTWSAIVIIFYFFLAFLACRFLFSTLRPSMIYRLNLSATSCWLL